MVFRTIGSVLGRSSWVRSTWALSCASSASRRSDSISCLANSAAARVERASFAAFAASDLAHS